MFDFRVLILVEGILGYIQDFTSLSKLIGQVAFLLINK